MRFGAHDAVGQDWVAQPCCGHSMRHTEGQRGLRGAVRGLFPRDVLLLCVSDAGMAPLGRWAWGVGPAASPAVPGVPVSSAPSPVSQLMGSGRGGGSPGDTALSHAGGLR